MLYGSIEFDEKYNLMFGYANNSFGNHIDYVALTVNFAKIYFAGIAYIKGYSKIETMIDSKGYLHDVEVPFTNDNGETITPIFGVQHRISEKAIMRLMVMGSAISVTTELGLF